MAGTRRELAGSARPRIERTSGDSRHQWNDGAGLRILVVGAGIAGLGAARALRQRGFAADVVEREPAWTHTGAGIYLPGNAARALRALGLESAVAERGSLIPHQRLCDHRGRLLADIDLAALWGDVGPCLALHRADLHEVLASHGDPVPVRMGLPVQRLSQHDDTVTVEFGDATADRYDLVIGADGIHSTVRQLAVGAGCDPTGRTARLALRHRLPAGGDHVDGAARAQRHLPGRADRPGPGLLLLRRAHRAHPSDSKATT